MGNGNRHERRKADAQARTRRRALLRMVGRDGAAELVALGGTEPAKAQLVLLRLAYRALKLGRITARQARLFGSKV